MEFLNRQYRFISLYPFWITGALLLLHKNSLKRIANFETVNKF